jgi:5-amino-6-(5-phosphoribosylamino)uracil reductase
VHVLLSAAVSADGYLDDASATRLVLSDAADWDEVDELRARSDAIMVGAQTIRRDNPRLLVKSEARRRQRLDRGLPANPQKVTITGSGDLDPGCRFFADKPPLVYTAAERADKLRARLGRVATIVPVPGQDHVYLGWVLADLAGRGYGRIMVEGGAQILEQFLAAGVADEIRLAVAPVSVADPAAPRLRLPAGLLRLAGVRQVGRMTVLRYLAGSQPGSPPGTMPGTR